MDRESRNYASGKEVSKITEAMALLIKSPVSKVLGNIFLGINKPPYPTKLFTDKEEAIKWLKGVKNEK